jgi:hypothetical protein
MNANATRLIHAVMIVAALAAVVIAMPAHAAPAKGAEVVVLPRVVVTGKHVEATQATITLPRVVVTGRRTDAAGAMQARRDDAQAKRTTTLVAMR